jgi:hypothetical protein
MNCESLRAHPARYEIDMEKPAPGAEFRRSAARKFSACQSGAEHEFCDVNRALRLDARRGRAKHG